jgi:hypothetical protein
VTGHIVTDRSKYEGELIEVHDSGIIILTEGTFRLVPYSTILSSRFDGMAATDSVHAPPSNVIEHLRLVSRFPQGLPPDLLAKLLASKGQTTLAGATP